MFRVVKLEIVGLALVLLLAAGLRFGFPGVNSFAFDEARLSLISLAMARAGVWAQFGMPSSAGVPNPPGAAWLFVLPYAFSSDPALATAFVGMLSLVTIAGVWWLARQQWGAWAGLTAALFLAASPYSVLYARNIWAQNLLPLLALLWAWTAYHSLTGGRRWSLVAHIFLAGFIFQVHLAGAALALGTAYFFFRFGWYRQIRWVALGGLLALLALLPFISGLLTQPEVAARFGGALRQPPQFDLVAVRNLLAMALGINWEFLAGGDLTGNTSEPAVMAAIAFLLLAGVIVLARGWQRGEARERRIFAELIFVWLLATPLFFMRHSTPVFPHYLLGALPAAALLVSGSTHLLSTRSWRITVTIVLLALAFYWSGQIERSLALAGRYEAPNGLGTPLGILRSAAYGLPDDVPALLFTHGDDPNSDGEAAIFSVLWWDRPHRISDGESLLILPPEPAWLMATLSPFPAWEELRAGGLAPDAAILRFPRREGAAPFVAVRYDGTSLPTAFTLVEPVRFASGAQLEAWRVRRIGQRLRVSTLWRVVDAPPAATIQQFHHLRTSDRLQGEPFMGADVPLSVHQWRRGDYLVVMGDFFDVPAGDYWVDIGHYTLPDVTRLLRADGGDHVRLGAFVYDPQQ